MNSVFIATSLDGYIARADHGLDWLKIVERPGEDYGFAAFFATVDTLVMGRGTYDVVTAFPEWPYGAKRIVVLTHRPAQPREGVEFFGGNIADLRLSGRTYVDGGNVIQQFLTAGLVDDMTISIIPIILGGGIRLFAGGEGEHRMHLEGHQAWDSGLVQLRYTRDRSNRRSNAPHHQTWDTELVPPRYSGP
jgi:dihydrofolate reductase